MDQLKVLYFSWKKCWHCHAKGAIEILVRVPFVPNKPTDFYTVTCFPVVLASLHWICTDMELQYLYGLRAIVISIINSTDQLSISQDSEFFKAPS